MQTPTTLPLASFFLCAATGADWWTRFQQTRFWRELTHVGSVPNIYQLAVGGVALLLVAMLAHRLERTILKVLALVCAVCCLAAAVVVGFLGDAARHMSLAGSKVHIGGVCRSNAECQVDSSCVKVHGTPRCWPPCTSAGKCFATFICVTADDKQRVCTW